MATDFGFVDQELGVKHASGHPRSVFLALMLFGMLLQPIDYVLGILQVYLTRRNEFAADRYSVELGYGLALRMGLIGIHINNAANLNPDPLYAALKFTHPALVERLAAIEKCMADSVNSKSQEKLPPSASQEEVFKRYQEIWKDKIVERHGQLSFEHQGEFVAYEKEKEADELAEEDEQKQANEGGEPEQSPPADNDRDDHFKKAE